MSDHSSPSVRNSRARAAAERNYRPTRPQRYPSVPFRQHDMATLRQLVEACGKRDFGAEWSGGEFSARPTPEGGWPLNWPAYYSTISQAPPPVSTIGSVRSSDSETSWSSQTIQGGRYWVPAFDGGLASFSNQADAQIAWGRVADAVAAARDIEIEERARLQHAANSALQLLASGNIEAMVLAPTGERRAIKQFFWDSEHAPEILSGAMSDTAGFPIVPTEEWAPIVLKGRAFVLRANMDAITQAKSSSIAAAAENAPKATSPASSGPNTSKDARPATQRKRQPRAAQYRDADRPLVAEMRELISSGEAATDYLAAARVAHKAAGPAQLDSKARRLLAAFRTEEGI